MSTKNTYRLINPYIEGSMDTIVHAKNPYSAGKKFYNKLSEYFTNHVEDFNMSVMNVETKDLTHYHIQEKRNGDSVDFFMNVLPEKLSSQTETKLINQVNKIKKQSGGRHYDDKDDSDSSYSSSSDIDYHNILPITRFTYFHLPYYRLIGLSPEVCRKIFLPVFSLPLSPTLEIRFDLYNF